jgi:hypothetical protein
MRRERRLRTGVARDGHKSSDDGVGDEEVIALAFVFRKCRHLALTL